LTRLNAGVLDLRHKERARTIVEERAMTGFYFSLEELRSAPPEVRRWVEREVAASMAALAGPGRQPAGLSEPALAACRPEEALKVFDLIKGDFLLSQVFFELARERPAWPQTAPLHAIGIADLLRHTRVSDGERLFQYFAAINRVFQAVRNDAEANLFGFDEEGHLYIHETTYLSIRQVWEHLHAAPSGASGSAGGFAPPHLGPSEDVATHAPSELSL
jgi:hypothetical protein